VTTTAKFGAGLPNQKYSLDPVTRLPVVARYDLGSLPPGLVCPSCGSTLLARIGSNSPAASVLPDDVLCRQCGEQFALG
jgi:hypothetical protein